MLSNTQNDVIKVTQNFSSSSIRSISISFSSKIYFVVVVVYGFFLICILRLSVAVHWLCSCCCLVLLFGVFGFYIHEFVFISLPGCHGSLISFSSALRSHNCVHILFKRFPSHSLYLCLSLSVLWRQRQCDMYDMRFFYNFLCFFFTVLICLLDFVGQALGEMFFDVVVS